MRICYSYLLILWEGENYMDIKVKRIYEQVSKDDGVRILVDRLWPRGVSKEEANLDHWLKDIGPSSELRKWFNHDPEKFNEFSKKYKSELQENKAQKEAFEQLTSILENGNKSFTLLFSAKEEKYNHVQILKSLIEKSK